MITVLFVGSNPSNASTSDIAFHASTKSSQTLDSWSAHLPIQRIHLNVVNKKTNNNRALTKEEIQQSLDALRINIEATKADRIIALGKTAAKALTLLRLNYYEMPHPSGLNRKLNDKSYVEEKIKGMEKFILPSPLVT